MTIVRALLCALLSAGCGARSSLEVLAVGGGAPSKASSSLSSSSGAGGAPACRADGASCDAAGECCDACVQGRCAVLRACNPGDPPALLASDVRYDNTSLAIDGEHVYYHRFGGLARVSKTGGSEVVVAPEPDVNPFYSFTLDGAYVYAATGVGGFGIARVAKVDLVEAHLDPPPAADYLVASGGWVHYLLTLSNEQRIGRFRPDGSGHTVDASVPVVPGMSLPNATLLADDEAVYYADGASLVRRRFADESVTAIAPSSLYVLGALDGADVVVTDGSRVLRMSKTGGPPTIVSNEWGWQFAFDETEMYFTDAKVLKKTLRAGGGASELIATAGPGEQTEQVAVDEACVYWVTTPSGAPGRLFRAPK